MNTKTASIIIGLAFFHYKPNGYEAIFGKNKVSLDISKDFVTETFEDFIITISLTGEYYHDYFGMWRTTHVATSKGQKGF